MVLNLIAYGKTKEFISKYLSLQNISDKEISKILISFTKLSEDPEVCSVANGIFFRKGLVTDETLVETLKKDNIIAKELNFADGEGTCTKINKWVADNTKNMIEEIISPDSIDEDSMVFVINTVYFNGKWQHKFNTKLVPGKFDGKKIQMMELPSDKKIELYYYQSDRYKVLTLPYENRFEMTIILPEKIDEEYTPLIVDRGQFSDKMREYKISEVKIPPFKKRLRVSYSEKREEMGLYPLFEKCSLRTLFPDLKSTFVSDIIHEVVIDDNTEGTKAAATSIGVAKSKAPSRPPPKIEFVADHAFSYCIRHSRSKVIMFSGVVTDFEEEISDKNITMINVEDEDIGKDLPNTESDSDSD